MLKPIGTIILAGKHPFDVFQNLQRTYSWMKYYNNELDISNKGCKANKKVLEELLQDVRKQINGSLALVRKPNDSETIHILNLY